MADILIRGIPKPTDCGKCFVGDRSICSGGCPLHELPEHGELIDRDALPEGRLEWEDIDNAPVIVPSNKEETE